MYATHFIKCARKIWKRNIVYIEGRGEKVKLAAYQAEISSVKGEKTSSFMPKFQSQSDELL